MSPASASRESQEFDRRVQATWSVLAIEDSRADVEVLRVQLKDRPEFELHCVDCLSDGIQRVAEGAIDVVLLDLFLPDSEGLDGLQRLRAQSTNLPIILLTGTDDEDIALGAMKQGAQDYLVKGKIDGGLLVRSLRYAIERQRLLEELEESRQGELHERELRLLERAVAIPGSPATASTFGQVPLREAKPAAFGELVQRYANLIDLALEQRTFKVEHDLSGQLRSLAEDERILATPTLIKELPDPVRRIIGDLSNREQVLLGLDLRRNPNPQDAQGDQP